jgi:hypothetical protein
MPQGGTVSPSSPITLADGQITKSDRLAVELHQPTDSPPVVVLRWPPAPSVFSPQRFPDAAAFLTRLFAEAATTLAAIKASRQL